MALHPAAYSRFVLPLLVLHLASACGGGSKPPTPEEDTTPPVTRADPTGGTLTTPVSVSLICDDGNGGGCAETHYTTDGSAPTQASPRYSTPLFVSATTTLKFFSVDTAGNTEAVKTEEYLFGAASTLTLTASPRGGTYGSAQTVTLTCSSSTGEACASIHYTTDGLSPSASSPAYSTAILVSTNTTLKFIGIDAQGRPSPVVTETYVIDTVAPTTAASPAGGAYGTAQNVTLTCDDSGGSGCQATYYTTDGSTPTRSSTVYSGAIFINRPTTLRFFSVDRLGNSESAKSESYTFTADVAPPITTASPAGGVYASPQNVTLTCDDGSGGSGCTDTYYTTNGSTPTTSSTRYTNPIAISANTVLKFFSVDARNNAEPVKSASYFIGRTPASISAQIAAVRAAADGAVNQQIDLALITYVKPSIGGDAPGFFLQAEPSGPAVFVAVAPSSINPVPVAGDRVTLLATQKATVNGMVHVTAITNYLRNGTGEPVDPLRANVTSVDLAPAVTPYESELISITGTLLDTLSPSGSGYVASTLSTSGSASNSNLQLRLPTLVQDTLDVSKGCNVTARAPLWRNGAQAQASGWVSNDFTVHTCPAPTVLSAASSGTTGVVIHLDRRIDPTSVQANGSQFTFTNGLTASAASVQDRDILLTTSAQTNGQSYTVTLATSIRDTLGSGMDATARTATFGGFQAPAVLRINEIAPNVASGRDLLELYVVQGGNISNFTIVRDTTTLTALPAVAVATGDIIVVHFNPDTNSGFDAPSSETSSKTQFRSATYASNYDNAWDIHGGTLGFLYNTNSVVLVNNAQGTTQDAVAFARPSVTTETFLPLLQELQSVNQWLPANCGGAPCTYSTSPTAVEVSASWDTVSTDRSTTSRRVGPTDTHRAADWAVGPASLGIP